MTPEQQERVDRMERLGWLAAGLVHDLNNALVSVLDELDVIGVCLGEMRRFTTAAPGGAARELGPAFDSCGHSLESIGATLQIAVNHGRELQRLYRGTPPNIGVAHADLRRAAEQALRLARAHLGPVVTEVIGETARVALDDQTVVRVLLNLLANARDAFLPENQNPRIAIRIGRGGAWALCDVIDNGPGVPAAILRRLFEPFVTTKPEDRGTGLGLAVSRDLMRAAGGDVTLLETGPRGTTFRISLPVASPAAR